MAVKMSHKIDRTGEISYTRYGTPAVIIYYKSNKECLIEFQDDFKYKCYVTYCNFKKCSIYNPYDKSYYGVGCLGVGKYNSKSRAISTWCHMLERCYNVSDDIRQASYEGCTVCDEWLNFQNFAKWYENNYYECSRKLNLDKDIIIHDNKVYSPNNCLLVPDRINSLFEKSKAIRGDLPIGVSRYWYDNSKYLAILKIGNRKSKTIGIYNTPTDAFNAYKKEKEKFIKIIANDYKNEIPKKTYNILMNYKVLITD